MPLNSMKKAVTTGGVAERLNASDQLVRSAIVRSQSTNTGSVYVGDATISSSGPGLVPGDSLSLRADPFLNLFDIFVDADQNGDGVDVWFIEYA
ncbi:MAG: hypothetical protein HQ478_04675 [Chloroflexi bacterium]|nr:hypothetical protein [Chloroflexota bacterium]